MARAGTRRREVDVKQRIDPRWVVAGAALVVLALLALGVRALIGSQESDDPEYTPATDDELVAELEELAGVSGVDLTHESGTYSGTVTVDGRRRLCSVLDEAYAILRQGEEGAAIEIEVAKQGGRSLTMQQVDESVAQDPTRRYGAQPGTGEPLDDELCSGDS